MLNPIMQLELISVLRTKRMLVLQCVLICVFTLLVLVRWPSEPRVALSGARSQQVFRLFGYGLLTTLLLLLPVFPATNIVREKKRGTLALLLNTPLGPWRIYIGKLLTVLALAGIVLSLSLPAAAACYALGGLSLTAEFPGPTAASLCYRQASLSYRQASLCYPQAWSLCYPQALS